MMVIAFFQSDFNKTYRSTDEETRKRLFASTHSIIRQHNNDNNEYQMGHNQFSDMVIICIILQSLLIECFLSDIDSARKGQISRRRECFV